jgi:hypothetical protein
LGSFEEGGGRGCGELDNVMLRVERETAWREQTRCNWRPGVGFSCRLTSSVTSTPWTILPCILRSVPVLNLRAHGL